MPVFVYTDAGIFVFNPYCQAIVITVYYLSLSTIEFVDLYLSDILINIS